MLQLNSGEGTWHAGVFVLMQVLALVVAVIHRRADDEPRVMAAPGLPHDEALRYAVIDGCAIVVVAVYRSGVWGSTPSAAPYLGQALHRANAPFWDKRQAVEAGSDSDMVKRPPVTSELAKTFAAKLARSPPL